MHCNNQEWVQRMEGRLHYLVVAVADNGADYSSCSGATNIHCMHNEGWERRETVCFCNLHVDVHLVVGG